MLKVFFPVTVFLIAVFFTGLSTKAQVPEFPGAQLPAFPGAEGGGMFTTGGRGGSIIHARV